jgi:hypothetical protein
MGCLGKTFASLVIILFLASTVLVSTTSAIDAPVWNIQTIDSTSSGAGDIALDSNSNPHMLYFHFENIETRTSLKTELLY